VEPPGGEKGFVIKYNSVGRDYFRTVGAYILRGRDFDRHEESSEQRVILINETMARRFWPDADPVGKSLTVDGIVHEIIGITQDGRISRIHEPPQPYLYLPFAQRPGGEGSIIVETTGDPLALAGAVKEQIRATGKGAVILQTETLEDIMGFALYEDRMIALLSAALGILGIILTSVGLYGVVAYLARRLTHEIGIRMALGARRADISRLVLGKGLRLAFIAMPIGLAISFLVMRLLADMLYGVAPTDLWVFCGQLSCSPGCLTGGVIYSRPPRCRDRSDCRTAPRMNMVRAGIVSHPGNWPRCGYHELIICSSIP
jgi:energy-converting hydrogenase Eha subunit C